MVRRRRSPRGPLRFALPIVLGLIGIVLVAAIAFVFLTRGAPHATVTNRCSNSQCVLVNTVHTSPVLTQYYGQSCQGVHGAWYLNVTQGGGAQVIRPSYRLNWTFADGQTVAKPSGSVDFQSTGRAQAKGTLASGVMTITGTGSTGAHVSGQGSLVVELSGSATEPSLTITESGLTTVEAKLGFQSPFVVADAPVTVPIRIVATAPGCGS